LRACRARFHEARQRETLAGIEARWVEHPAELKPASGFLYANEVLDALPVRLLQWPDEVLVDADASGRLVETLQQAEPAIARLLSAQVEPRVGARYAVRPSMLPLVASLVGSVRRGRVALIDYGGVGTEVHDGRRPPVRTYIGGQQGGDPLQAPGTQDLTADVDFGALTDAATAGGVEVEQVLTQPDWLRSHGWETPPADVRTEEDWALAGLLDERLPFMVWLARR
jgi:SAM-dependent MidA family methyltransferase